MPTLEVQTDRYGFKFFPRGREFAAWEIGMERIDEEGSNAWHEIRERHGLSRADLESLSSGGGNGSYSVGGHVFCEEVQMAEDRPGLPKMEHLCVLAMLEGVSPGALLDRVLIAKGEELESEEREAEST